MNFHIFPCCLLFFIITATSSITLESFLRNTYDQMLRLLLPNNPLTPPYNITYELYTRQMEGLNLKTKDIHLLNNTKPLYIIIHGWLTEDFTWMLDMKDALLKRQNCEVILVEWTQESNIDYFIASLTTKYIGIITGCLLHYLYETYSINLTSLHLIGHSLGAHVAGNAGRTVKNLTKIPIGRLTGLDPAGPLFNILLDDVRLKKTDAVLVDVLHTDAFIFGTFDELGDVEFYPNGGEPPQPGCGNESLEENICSHIRSHQLYRESILNEKAFLSTLCVSYEKYLEGKCDGNKNITIGGAFGISDSGSYYCKTKRKFPYSYS